MQENSEEVHQFMMDDRQVTISQTPSSVGISHVKVWYILHNELGMQMVSLSWVLQILTSCQTPSRMTMSLDHMAIFETEPTKFLKRFLTQEEFLAYHLELDAQGRSMQ